MTIKLWDFACNSSIDFQIFRFSEYCHPEIGYPNSTLKEWKCKNRIARWKSETIEREFHSDSLGEIDKNCISNDPRCKCQEQSQL